MNLMHSLQGVQNWCDIIMNFQGLIKGTPLPSESGAHIQWDLEKIPLRVFKMNGDEAQMSPSYIFWKWVPSVTFIVTDKFSLKTTPNTLLSHMKTLIPASDLVANSRLDYQDSDATVLKVKTYRVLAPMCCMLFEEPVVMSVKGAYVFFNGKDERKDLINDESTQKYADEECFQKELFQD